MRIADLFETRVEEKIEPVIKVGETKDERKLASEIGSYVVTPLIEKYLDDYLEHYTESFLTQTTEIGVWISGYFGSGKSHLAKIIAVLAENRKLVGVPACERFIARIPPQSSRQGSLHRSLSRMDQSATNILAFNLNTIADSRSRPLPSILLSQYYLSRGYGGNLIYARVIEAELDRQGKLEALHRAVETRANKSWPDIQRNLSFYRKHLYEAACEVAPEVFESPQDVERALKEAEHGELYNVGFLIDTVLDDLRRREKEAKKPQRMLFVLDESGQWIENEASRLAQLQALIEEAAIKGQGRIWVIVTTHGDMGSIFKEARALEGDMKKIEGRFRFKFGLTTENIELVLEDRLFKKVVAGKHQLEQVYLNRGGTLRGLGELANTSQTLPACTKEKFVTYYPFFPYQVHLIPEIVKSLRSKGGRGEQLSGSTRTLLAITQDILRSGRRQYLDEGIGVLVSFDEIYGNLSGEGEVSPDVRTELSRLKDVIPGATELTPKVAEVLYLIREIPYIPRTKDNLARLLCDRIDEDLPAVLARVEPELERLIKAKLVARIGEEYEFLTGERRTFEDEVATIEEQYRQQDRERGLVEHFIYGGGKAHWRKWLDFETVSHLGMEFPFRLQIDGFAVPGRQGDIALKVSTPLAVLGAISLDDLENQSLRSDEQNTIFFYSGRVKGFDREITRDLAMKEVIDNWKGDPHRSEDARKLAQERESNDLPKLERKVVEALKEGIRSGWTIFRGSSRSLAIKQGQKPSDALRTELSTFWPVLYPKFDRVPVRIVNDQRAIQEVLAGSSNPSKDVLSLKLYDKAGKIDVNCPLLDAIRMYLSTEQNAGRRVLGKDLVSYFSAPPHGWDPNAVRIGVAAFVRSAAVKILINKKAFANPTDRELVDALRVSRSFDRVECVLELADVDREVLTETRSFLISLTKQRGIDETPAAISEGAESLADSILARASTIRLWAGAARMPLPESFLNGEDAWKRVKELSNPVHRVIEFHGNRELLEEGCKAIERHVTFQTDNGARFTELQQMVTQLAGIEHLFEQDGIVCKLLDAYRATAQAADFADKETWKQIQSLKAQAVLDLQGFVEEKRNEARGRVDAVLNDLSDELDRRGLSSDLETELSAPLRNLRDGMDEITAPVKAAALAQQVEAAIRAVGEKILRKAAEQVEADAERDKPEEDAAQPAQPKDKRPANSQRVHTLRVGEVVTVTRVATFEDWDKIKERLDTRVRELLNQGLQVEFG